jgi:REP element-mobilizing transposase RayT
MRTPSIHMLFKIPKHVDFGCNVNQQKIHTFTFLHSKSLHTVAVESTINFRAERFYYGPFVDLIYNLSQYLLGF